ncbi:MAG: hypothetical protein JWQ57_1081 [Mucilaginibacter sp.]|nr:hypothetical protein [Mucilaginibacter sp.]
MNAHPAIPIPVSKMKMITCFFILLITLDCNHINSPAKKALPKKPIKTPAKSYKEIKYSDQQLIAFFDSVGKLPIQPLADKVAFEADSVFRNFMEPMNRQLSITDFALLKQAIKAKRINAHMAKQIFGEFTADSNCNMKGLLDSVKKGYVYLRVYPFFRNNNRYDEFAVGVADGAHCPGAMIYYFRGRKIIAKQEFSRDTTEPEYFTNVDGENIVYTVYEFTHGSGVSWLNYFFYKYDGDKLIPVLNELANGNAQLSWIGRVLWLDATVKRTNPLTIKMVYYNHFVNEDRTGWGPVVINDSTIVSYKWDEKSKTLIGQYEKTKINKAQILSYYLDNNSDLLFMNVLQKPLRKALKNKENRPLLLRYLRNVKNYQDTVGR